MAQQVLKVTKGITEENVGLVPNIRNSTLQKFVQMKTFKPEKSQQKARQSLLYYRGGFELKAL